MSRSSRRRSRLLIDDEWDGEDTRFSAGLRDCMNVIYGILIAIFVVTSVALIFIYIRRVRRADSNLRERVKSPVVEPPVPEEEDSNKEAVSKIRMIANKLNEKKFRVEEDWKIGDVNLNMLNYSITFDVSDSTYIKLSEIGAIVTESEKTDIKYDAHDEADGIYKFKQYSAKHQKKYKSLINLVEAYLKFRVNFKETE